MKKIIVQKNICLLIFFLVINYCSAQLTTNACDNYHPDQLIIQIETQNSPFTISGTSAFTNFEGTVLDSIMDGLNIYLVEFTLPNLYFNSIEDVHQFYSCGGGINASGNGTKVRVRKMDYNYIINTDPSINTGGIFDLIDYRLYEDCNQPFMGIPYVDDPYEIDIAVVDAGHQMESPFDDMILIDEGYDFIDNDPIADDNSYDQHGTRVESVIAGLDYNNVDDIKITPIKVLDSDGSGDLFTLYQGINHAIRQEVNIINLSLGTLFCDTDTCTVIFDALMEKALSEDILVVGAAGNDANNIDELYYIPGSSKAENLIVVSSSKCYDTPSLFTNYGPLNSDLMAPGEKVIVYPNGLATGTSFSAPQVTAVAAKRGLLSPDFDPLEIKCAIMRSASITGRWTNHCQTGGILDYRDIFSRCINPDQTHFVSQNNIGEYEPVKSRASLKSFFSSNKELTFEYESDIAQNIQLRISDLSGRILSTKQININEGKNYQSFEIEGFEKLPAGLYLVSIITGDKQLITQKCIKTL